MAGSAVNLTGMLSSMNESMGSMGAGVSKGLFDPLLQMQEDERLKQRQIATEDRAAARAEAERQAILTRKQATVESYSGPMQRYEAAKLAKDANAARAAAQELREAAGTAGDKEALAEANRMLGSTGQIANEGALKGIRAINQALADPALPAEARTALTNRKEELMRNPAAAATLQAEADAATDRDAQQLAMKQTRGSIEAQERTKVAFHQAETRAKDTASGTVAGGSASIYATPEQIKKAKLGKSDEWSIAFDAARTNAIQRVTQLNEIKKNELMTEEEFAAFGDTGMTYEDYEKAGNGMGSYQIVNQQLRSRSDARYAQSLRPNAVTVKAPTDGTRKEAREILMASGEDVDGLEWGQDVTPEENDVHLLGLAMANTIEPTKLMTYVVDGALTDAGRKAITESLNAQGIDTTMKLVRPSWVPEGEWNEGSEAEKANLMAMDKKRKEVAKANADG